MVDKGKGILRQTALPIVITPNTAYAKPSSSGSSSALDTDTTDIELLARRLFLEYRDAVQCPNSTCLKKGQFTLSSTQKKLSGRKYLRFQCKCHKSMSASSMLHLLHKLPSLFPDDTKMLDDILSTADITITSSGTYDNENDSIATTSAAVKRSIGDTSFQETHDTSRRIHFSSDREDECTFLRLQIRDLQQQNKSQMDVITALTQEVRELKSLIVQYHQDKPPSIAKFPDNQPSESSPVPVDAFRIPPVTPGNGGNIISHMTLPSHQLDIAPQILPHVATASLQRGTAPQSLITHPIHNAGRRSYADVVTALGLVGDDHQKALKAIGRLSRRPATKRVGRDLVRIYVQGIYRKSLRMIKEDLRALRFRTSMIHNISFIGAATMELLISPDYLSAFKRRFTELASSTRWRILDAYDASTAADANADEGTKTRLQQAFLTRVHTIIESTQQPEVRASYEQWLRTLQLPLPTSCLPTKNPAISEDIIPMNISSGTMNDVPVDGPHCMDNAGPSTLVDSSVMLVSSLSERIHAVTDDHHETAPPDEYPLL